jgi:hypothetical protein
MKPTKEVVLVQWRAEDNEHVFWLYYGHSRREADLLGSVYLKDGKWHPLASPVRGFPGTNSPLVAALVGEASRTWSAGPLST